MANGLIDKIKNFKIMRTKKLYVVLIAVVLASAALGAALFLPGGKPAQEKPIPIPSVSIGCDRVLWKGTGLELVASTQNIARPSFEWVIDGKTAGTAQRISQKFDPGEHRVALNVTFDNKTLTANQTTVITDSTDGVSVRDYIATNNQWGFQTVYRGRNFGVKGVRVYVDSLSPSEVSSCGSLSTKALPAGAHTWKAEYQGRTIASGTFNLKEISEVKISRVDVAPSYVAGSTVNGKITLKNTGSTSVTEFDIKTVALNNNYAWLGDKAKREYLDHYSADLKPGELYEIPIRMTIPESVGGIRPSGRYTVTITLMLKGKEVDTKAVNTEIK